MLVDFGRMWEIVMQLAWIVVKNPKHSQVYATRAGQSL